MENPTDLLHDWTTTDGAFYRSTLESVYRTIERRVVRGCFNRHDAISWIGNTVLRKAGRACFAELFPDQPVDQWRHKFPPAVRIPVATALVNHCLREIDAGNSWLGAA
jgi:hypothetical protein